MSYYCKNCGQQSMNEPFEDNLCDTCWEKKHGKNKEAKNAILEIMERHVGVENAITDKTIRGIVEVMDPDRMKPTAGLRDIINALRREGHPICSGIVGYWYAKDILELEENIQALDGRALKIMSATKGMRACLDRWKNAGQAKII